MLLDRTTLSRALNNAARIASSRATLPVLANVKLARVGADLYLQATDLERGLEQRIAIPVPGDDFSTTVNARMLADTVNALDAAFVELKLNERGTKLSVEGGRAALELPTIPASEFPPFAPMPPVRSEVDAAAFADAASRVMMAASTEEALPVMQGVYCDGQAMAATDGFRIHIAPFVIGKANIPARSMAEAVKLFGKAQFLTVASAGGQWFVSDNETTLISQVIEGNFPDWRAIEPKDHKATIEFQVQPLLAALKRVQIIQPADNVVRLDFTDGITITGQSEETGAAEDRVDAVVTGAPPMIAVNVRFFVQALEAVRINPARLHVNQANTPLVVEDGSGWRAVVMPMHLEGK